MTRSLASLLLLFTAVLLAGAQDVPPSQIVPSLAGTVVGEPGSHPLKKVIVQVVSEDQKQGGNYSAATDNDGHFRVENVSPGRYRVFLEKTGFIEVNGRGQKAEVNVVTVPVGRSVEEMMFHMLPTAVITGRITDEDGDPMSGVRVAALRKVAGKTRRESVNAVGTNDQGEYRLSGLFPGQYWIAAMPPPDFRDYERPRGKAEGADDPAETRYLTTYYPGTYDSVQASPIAVKAGDEMPVNVTLVPARTYRIRGLVTSVVPGERPSVEMVSKTGDLMQASEVGPDGSFELHGAAPGTYELKAYTTGAASVMTARQEVTVVAADVEGVKLAPLPAFQLSGHLHLDGRSSVAVSQYSVNLRQADVTADMGLFMSDDSSGENAQVDGQGNFAWKNVNPGVYVLRLYGGTGRDESFLKSAKIGERNADAEFTVSGPAVLDLVVSSNSATVEGVVMNRDEGGSDQNGGGQDRTEKPASNVSVVAVPEEKYRKIPEHFGVGATDQYGRFAIRGLAPGSYMLYAWQDAGDELYRDADFLRSQTQGKAVKVEEGSRQHVDLTLSSVGEEWK